MPVAQTKSLTHEQIAEVAKQIAMQGHRLSAMATTMEMMGVDEIQAPMSERVVTDVAQFVHKVEEAVMHAARDAKKLG